jgi:hypothetical protein
MHNKGEDNRRYGDTAIVLSDFILGSYPYANLQTVNETGDTILKSEYMGE